MNREGTSHILCKRDIILCFSVGSNHMAEKGSDDLTLAGSVFTIHFVFVQREGLLFGFAIFCLQIYSFIQFIFICFLFLFHSNLLFFAVGKLILLCPR